MIDPHDFARKPKGHGPAMVNIRLRPVRRADGTVPRPTADAVRAVLQQIVDSEGVVPDGWAFAAIEWRNPKKATAGWTTGQIADFAMFKGLLTAALAKARIAVVPRRDVERP